MKRRSTRGRGVTSLARERALGVRPPPNPTRPRQRALDVLTCNINALDRKRIPLPSHYATHPLAFFLRPHSRAPGVRALRPSVTMGSHAPTALELRLSRELRASRRRVKRVGGAALLPLGVITSLASKLAYEMRTHDAPFHKPLFMTLVSFVAMSLCALPQIWHALGRDARRRRRRRDRTRVEADRASHDSDPTLPAAAASTPSLAVDAGLDAPLLAETDDGETDACFSGSDRAPGEAPRGTRGTRAADPSAERRRRVRRGPSLRSVSLRLAPAAFADVLATALISHAILRLPLSAFLSLRHFQLVCAAVVAAALRRELNPLHKLGVSLSLSGAALVFLSAEIAETDASGRARVAAGAACLLLSQITQTLALTFETRAAAADDGAYGSDAVSGTRGARRRGRLLSPSTALGIEGVVGTAFLSCVVMPLAQALSGVAAAGGGDAARATIASAAGEDSRETVRALVENRNLAALVACYLFGLAAYNHAGASLARVMGVMSRTKLETSRTLLCWALAAKLECGMRGDGACFPGEAGLPLRLVSMRFAGFVMGTLGTLLYGRGDAAERQRVFERDPLAHERARASGRRRPRRQRRAGGRRDSTSGNARFEASSDADGAFDSERDAASDGGDVEASARPSQRQRLSFSGGFGSPVGVGVLDDPRDDEDETRDRLRRESGFGSGSLRSSMAFSSFGGEAAPRSVAGRPERAAAVGANAAGPARVVEGFPEHARER